MQKRPSICDVVQRTSQRLSFPCAVFQEPRRFDGIRSLLLCIAVSYALIGSLAQRALGDSPSSLCKARRKAYCERIEPGVTVIFDRPEGSEAEYHADKDFFYLTGFSEPGAILVLSPRHPQHHETLFIAPRNPAQEKWTGPRTDVSSETAARLGFERVVSLDSFQSELLRLAEGERKVYTVLPVSRSEGSHDRTGQVERLKRLFPFAEFLDARSHIAFLRMKKSSYELDLVRKAIQITMDGQKAAAGEIASGKYEYEIQAALEYQFRRQGASRPAFPSIVGSGRNSTYLHYEKNDRKMQEGDLVVVDIGAEYGEYAADITRTFPVSGRFTARQRELYNIVLDAQEAALKEVKPGAILSKSGAVHKAAFDYINSHGKDLKGNSLGQYFVHGTSHHLGLDVHDAVDDNSRPLEPGMVITVEPGLYIPDEDLGIRIEDDVLVTETGCELLTRTLPRRAEAIEQFMLEQKRK